MSYARHNAGTIGDNSNLWDLPHRIKPYVYGVDSQMITPVSLYYSCYIVHELQLYTGTSWPKSQQPLERSQLTHYLVGHIYLLHLNNFWKKTGFTNVNYLITYLIRAKNYIAVHEYSIYNGHY